MRQLHLIFCAIGAATAVLAGCGSNDNHPRTTTATATLTAARPSSTVTPEATTVPATRTASVTVTATVSATATIAVPTFTSTVRPNTATATATATTSQTASATPTTTPLGTPTGTASALLLFAPEGEDLNVYDPDRGFAKQVLISGNEDESRPDLPAVNGEVCFDPNDHGRFVLADDHTQPNPPPHWTVMRLHGSRIGDLSYEVIREIGPTFQGGVDTADPVGCAFLPDGRLLTTDIGNNESGPSDGQLTLWFTPIDGATPHYCKLDIAIGTAGAIYVDEQERIYVASARNEPSIYRYSPPFPTSDTAEGGCGRRDDTGAPLADSVLRERFIVGDSNVPTPNAIVGSGHGTYYVTSVINGVIAEYDADGKFLRKILQPPAGEVLGPKPYSTGNPFGLAIDAAGTLYYSDLGIIFTSSGIGPGHRLGTVRRLRFSGGEPLPPETVDSQLAFPDGVGLFTP